MQRPGSQRRGSGGRIRREPGFAAPPALTAPAGSATPPSDRRAPLVPRPRPRRRWRRLAWIGSALLHALLLAALVLIGLKRQAAFTPLPQPANVAMVFQSGAPKSPSAKGAEKRPGAPPIAAESPPAPAAPIPPPRTPPTQASPPPAPAPPAAPPPVAPAPPIPAPPPPAPSPAPAPEVA
ncbi:MAG: hypothetical protein KGL12_02715, partial [Rhodospirillales bacterium]|nr:hypothetical protein [Rhodospirillales bacterium]